MVRLSTSAVLILLLSGCAMSVRPVDVWYRDSPKDWTPPKKFAHCEVNGEVIIENGKPHGRDVVRLDCLRDEETVYVDKRTGRVAWRQHWWGW